MILHLYLKSWWYDLQFLRIRVGQTKIGDYGSVFALLTLTPTLLKTQKIGILRKWKNCWRCHFTHVYQKTIIWGTVSEIEWDRQIFLSFYSPNNPVNQNFEKMKNAYEDVIILYTCTKNPDHMVYAF